LSGTIAQEINAKHEEIREQRQEERRRSLKSDGPPDGLDEVLREMNYMPTVVESGTPSMAPQQPPQQPPHLPQQPPQQPPLLPQQPQQPHLAALISLDVFPPKAAADAPAVAAVAPAATAPSLTPGPPAPQMAGDAGPAMGNLIDFGDDSSRSWTRSESSAEVGEIFPRSESFTSIGGHRGKAPTTLEIEASELKAGRRGSKEPSLASGMLKSPTSPKKEPCISQQKRPTHAVAAPSRVGARRAREAVAHRQEGSTITSLVWRRHVQGGGGIRG
jgi:hypothetical protein